MHPLPSEQETVATEQSEEVKEAGANSTSSISNNPAAGTTSWEGRPVSKRSMDELRKVFESLWKDAEPCLLGYCMRKIEDKHLAKDIVQEVAIRAWRRFDVYDHDKPFIAWVMTITKNEVNRALWKYYRRVAVELTTDPTSLPEQEICLSGIQSEEMLQHWKIEIRHALAAASKVGFLRDYDVQVILARLDNPKANWQEIAAEKGKSADVAAQSHGRGMQKLRVFLFLFCQNLFGGHAEIERAFAECVDSLSYDKLAPQEAEAFLERVLKKNPDYCRAGWQTALRSACEKVICKMRSPWGESV